MNQNEKLAFNTSNGIFVNPSAEINHFTVKAFPLNIHSVTEMQVPKNAKPIGLGIYMGKPAMQYLCDVNQNETELIAFRASLVNQPMEIKNDETYELVAALQAPEGSLFVWEVKGYKKPVVPIFQMNNK